MLKKFQRRALAGLRAWLHDSSGVVAFVVIFTLPAFIAAAGVAVDLAQAYNIKTHLSNALDKAALAAGSTDGATNTPAQIEDRINAFITANYPSDSLGLAYDIDVRMPVGQVDITAHAKVKTVFMNIFGQEYIDVVSETIVKREVTGLELVLVMDNTGSMADPAGGSQTKIEAAKGAAHTLLDILFGNDDAPALFVGVVPFSQAVNINSSRSSWTTSDSFNFGPTSWDGCVEARETSGSPYTGSRDLTDDPPSTQKFPRYYSACDASYTGNVWYQTPGTEQATNGDFASATGWTVGTNWAISGGVLTRSAPAPVNVVTNGNFSSGSGWTLDTGWNASWTISGGLLQKAAPPELVTGGDFASSSGWTIGSAWAVSGGVLTNTPAATATSAATTRAPTASIISGHSYKSVFTVVTRTAGTVKSTVGNVSGATHSTPNNTTYTETLAPTSTSPNTIGLTGASFKGTVDNFSVKDVTTRIASYTPSSPALVSGVTYQVIYTIVGYTTGSVTVQVGGTSGTARNASGTYTQNIVAGGTGTVVFTTSDGFGGTIDDVSVIDTTPAPLTGTVSRAPASAIVANTSYTVTYTISARTAGSVKATVGNKNGTVRSANGTYTETLKPTNASPNTLTFVTSDGFLGTIDNFSVKALSDCGAGPGLVYKSPLDNVTQGPNLLCPASVLGMTTTKADIVAKIDAMQPQGSTMIDLGMGWGWRMLSPNWRDLWGGEMDDYHLPLDYDHPGMNKVVILMTDGDNSFGSGNYTAFGNLSAGRVKSPTTGSSTTSSTTANTYLNAKTTQICASMKAHNILIYTIALGADLNTTSQNMLKTCATGPAYYFASPTTASLSSAFTTIANQLNSLYIVH